MTQPGHALSFSQVEQWGLTAAIVGRLLLASVLGGAVGLDREFRHKASGIRTNLLICFGAALFTYLSAVVAGEGSTNKGQIASNIVQGVGFLGAGLILHNRNRISGLTSAATVFAVAAIGMASGAGLYLPATFATVLVIAALEFVGMWETKSNLKMQIRIYEVRGTDSQALTDAVVRAMDQEERRLQNLQQDRLGSVDRVSFPVMATHKKHKRLVALLESEAAVQQVRTFHSWEEE
ncbi:MAG: MgtC/SapB family protein [Acidobacteriaceae bacterium]